MFSKDVLHLIKRLQTARIALMRKQPFYAVLLLHMGFAVDTMCETAYTDGNAIVFCPDFIDTLSDSELEFVLMHEVMHAALNHCGRGMSGKDYDAFNTACDIVVNSNILYSCDMDKSAITLKNYGESMHLTPDGKEGYLFSAEEVFRMILAMNIKNKNNGNKGKENPFGSPGAPQGKQEDEQMRSDGGFDDHTFWGGDDESSDMSNVWLQRMVEATQIATKMRERGGGCGSVPAGAERIIKKLMEPQTDWRTILDNFVQEDICDYSFNPPDRRLQDSPFFLPDFNEKEETVKDILFMIDTSGSMTDVMITQAYSEIKGAIDQFGGRLSGWLGFFDAEVTEPKAFCDEEEFRIIRAFGGGGTSFKCIFEYIKEHIKSGFEPVSIIILTDGFAPFPDESDAMGIPVLWVINNEDVTPPWGKIARITIN